MINEELHALYEKKIAELQADLAASRAYADGLAAQLAVGCLPKDVENLHAANAALAVELSAARAELEAEETASGKLLAECEWYRRELVESRAENAWRVTVEQVKAWLESWNLDENPSMEVTDAECGILASLASAKEPT